MSDRTRGAKGGHDHGQSAGTLARLRRRGAIGTRSPRGDLPPGRERRALGAAHQGLARADPGPGDHRSPDDPRVLYACLSPAARSQDGSLYRSLDLGETWTRFDRGVTAETTMMAVALHPRDPDQVYCTTRGGQVFGAGDGGRTWDEHRLPDGVRDVYAIACG